MSPSIEDIQQELRVFAKERNWDQFHTPRNLVLALVAEVGELSEVFQWTGEMSAEELVSDQKLYEHFKEELSDVFIYLLRLADKANVDLVESAKQKIQLNASKYPASEVFGKSDKR